MSGTCGRIQQNLGVGSTMSINGWLWHSWTSRIGAGRMECLAVKPDSGQRHSPWTSWQVHLCSKARRRTPSKCHVGLPVLSAATVKGIPLTSTLRTAAPCSGDIASSSTRACVVACGSTVMKLAGYRMRGKSLWAATLPSLERHSSWARQFIRKSQNIIFVITH